jgi:Putative peptidoglycan binding domain/D-alanyl-D-alanine carboxypeptidase
MVVIFFRFSSYQSTPKMLSISEHITGQMKIKVCSKIFLINLFVGSIIFSGLNFVYLSVPSLFVPIKNFNYAYAQAFPLDPTCDPTNQTCPEATTESQCDPTNQTCPEATTESQCDPTNQTCPEATTESQCDPTNQTCPEATTESQCDPTNQTCPEAMSTEGISAPSLPEESQASTNTNPVVDGTDNQNQSGVFNTEGGGGLPSNLSLNSLANSCNPSSPTLSIKAKGPEVTNLQNILIALGYNVGSSGADGNFGPNTQAAVFKFQQDNGLNPDGKVGLETWGKLCSFTTSTTTGGGTPNQQTTATSPDSTQMTTTTLTETTDWIHDPNASVLDKLPSGSGQYYRDFDWERYDYPGKNKADSSPFPEKDPGPNEEIAKKMFTELRNLIPERRPTAGATAVFCAAKDGRCNPIEIMNDIIWKHVLDSETYNDGRGHKLNKYAGASFAKMQAAAKKDGVELQINNSHRSCESSNIASQKLGAGSGKAIAACPNSHNLGLAIDFNMNQDDWPLNQAFEVSTGPFSNIIKMMQSPVYKWLYLNAKTYDWYPYIEEPWHWEYNPVGFRTQFYADCNCDPRSSS